MTLFYVAFSLNISKTILVTLENYPARSAGLDY